MAIEYKDGDSLTPEQIKELVKERDEAKASVTNTVEEIKDLRKKNQEATVAKAEAERKATELAARNDQSGVLKPEDVDRLVAEKLNNKFSEQEKVVIKAEEEAAFAEFISANPEFDKATDTTGLRMETFKKELARFNLSGAKKKDDFLAVMKDAITLLYRKENKEYTSPYASSPSNGGGSPQVQDANSLTPAERDTMKRLGWDAKKFTEMKLKHPELYESVFKK